MFKSSIPSRNPYHWNRLSSHQFEISKWSFPDYADYFQPEGSCWCQKRERKKTTNKRKRGKFHKHWKHFTNSLGSRRYWRLCHRMEKIVTRKVKPLRSLSRKPLCFVGLAWGSKQQNRKAEKITSGSIYFRSGMDIARERERGVETCEARRNPKR